MALRADYAQAAGLQSLRFQFFDLGFNGLGISAFFLRQTHFEIAAQLDIRAAPRHIGGNGHRAGHAGLRDDLRFLFVIARIQHIVFNLFGFQRRGQFL